MDLAPHYQNDGVTIHLGDCLDVMQTMPANSIDSIVTDPPYGLKFMGKKWDCNVPSVEVWAECLRVLKPGGHLLAFAGTRTQHRMCCNIEDAGFEIRDMIAWVYGSGFPKSHNISKAIDKAAGYSSASTYKPNGKNNTHGEGWGGGVTDITSAPATEAAQQWDGWGTALKPALEPITLARKPLSEKTIAANVLEHGTGGVNVDGCRVKSNGRPLIESRNDSSNNALGGRSLSGWPDVLNGSKAAGTTTQGRFPANLIHDGSEEVVELFPQSSDEGSAARFFYCPKSSKSDRGEGNNHPTVKPTDLMRYLCRLITPPGGAVLDPFIGSGSTAKAARLEGFDCVGIDLNDEYLEIAAKRIEAERQTEWI